MLALVLALELGLSLPGRRAVIRCAGERAALFAGLRVRVRGRWFCGLWHAF